MKPAKHLHLVYLVHCIPNFSHFVIDKMSDCGKAKLPAVRHKEDMPIGKKISMPMQTFCWSCNSSQGTFTKL
jgi:hypothetical protein